MVYCQLPRPYGRGLQPQFEMKISFWKALSLVGLLAEELGKAVADNKITIAEALYIVEVICQKLRIDFDKARFDLVKSKFDKGE